MSFEEASFGVVREEESLRVRVGRKKKLFRGLKLHSFSEDIYISFFLWRREQTNETGVNTVIWEMRTNNFSFKNLDVKNLRARARKDGTGHSGRYFSDGRLYWHTSKNLQHSPFIMQLPD